MVYFSGVSIDTYAEVCKEVREEVYPEELLDAVPDPSNNRQAAERWFASAAKVGANSALKMALLYQVLVEADLSKRPETTPKNSSASKKSSTKTVKKTETPLVKDSQQSSLDGPIPSTMSTPVLPNSSPNPTIHIDIQIHISSEASTAQIDQIFASMAKHLYKRDE